MLVKSRRPALSTRSSFAYRDPGGNMAFCLFELVRCDHRLTTASTAARGRGKQPGPRPLFNQVPLELRECSHRRKTRRPPQASRIDVVGQRAEAGEHAGG